MPSPKTEDELLTRCRQIEGLSFSQLASRYQLAIPELSLQRKGWLGQLIELALGTNAGNLALPDFMHLGIELKTLPISNTGRVTESTFLCTIPLLTFHEQCWEDSSCYKKLKKILWIPVEGDKAIPYAHRRIGQALLWSPNIDEEEILRSDWQYFNDMLSLGRLEEIDARHGEYLQIRPKGANARSLVSAYGAEGQLIKTLPRGFYLRSSFTQNIVA